MTDIDYRIRAVRLNWGQMPVRLTFSYGAVDTFPFLLLRIAAGGQEGLGEVLVPPTPFAEQLAQSLLGRDCRARDALLPPTDNDHDRILCEAFSMALHDLVARLCGFPLWALLGGAEARCVPLMPCLFPHSASEAREQAARYAEQGYRFLKVKLVGDLEEDLARVQAVRAVFPPPMTLQGDANEGYRTLETARAAVRTLGEAGLTIFEDPLRGGVEDYARLRGAGGAQVMVDALARRTADLAAVLRLGAADVIGIHPDQPGSLTRVLEHAAMARAFGVPVVMGGTGFTGVGSAAYQHLTAVATPGGPCGELGGCFDHGMPAATVREPLPMQDGCVRLPDRPGLGVELDESTLARFAPDCRQWEV